MLSSYRMFQRVQALREVFARHVLSLMISSQLSLLRGDIDAMRKTLDKSIQLGASLFCHFARLLQLLLLSLLGSQVSKCHHCSYHLLIDDDRLHGNLRQKWAAVLAKQRVSHLHEQSFLSQYAKNWAFTGGKLSTIGVVVVYQRMYISS